MAIRQYLETNWSSLFDVTLYNAGDYVYWWYSSASVGKQFQRLIYRDNSGTHTINNSFWLKY